MAINATFGTLLFVHSGKPIGVSRRIALSPMSTSLQAREHLPELGSLPVPPLLLFKLVVTMARRKLLLTVPTILPEDALVVRNREISSSNSNLLLPKLVALLTRGDDLHPIQSKSVSVPALSHMPKLH